MINNNTKKRILLVDDEYDIALVSKLVWRIMAL